MMDNDEANRIEIIKEYPFPWPHEEIGYNLFPQSLENDELVAFHGTARENLQPIMEVGFKFARTLQSLSFAKESAFALPFACRARSEASPEGCVIAVRFKPPLQRAGITVEPGVIHVFNLQEKPEVIGYCIVPADYDFR